MAAIAGTLAAGPTAGLTAQDNHETMVADPSEAALTRAGKDGRMAAGSIAGGPIPTPLAFSKWKTAYRKCRSKHTEVIAAVVAPPVTVRVSVVAMTIPGFKRMAALPRTAVSVGLWARPPGRDGATTREW